MSEKYWPDRQSVVGNSHSEHELAEIFEQFEKVIDYPDETRKYVWQKAILAERLRAKNEAEAIKDRYCVVCGDQRDDLRRIEDGDESVPMCGPCINLVATYAQENEAKAAAPHCVICGTTERALTIMGDPDANVWICNECIRSIKDDTPCGISWEDRMKAKAAEREDESPPETTTNNKQACTNCRKYHRNPPCGASQLIVWRTPPNGCDGWEPAPDEPTGEEPEEKTSPEPEVESLEEK
jgi:hypothetical protein